MKLTTGLIAIVSIFYAVWVIRLLWRYHKLTTLDIREILGSYIFICVLILFGSMLIKLISN